MSLLPGGYIKAKVLRLTRSVRPPRYSFKIPSCLDGWSIVVAEQTARQHNIVGPSINVHSIGAIE